MATFHYVVVALNGREQKGVLEADSEKHARQLLRDKSLLPLHITPLKEKKSNGKQSLFYFLHVGLRKQTLSGKDLAIVTRQFATLLSSGLPIESALLAVSEQTEKSYLKGLILSVRSKIIEGHSLAHALREHPKAFSALYCATIAAGEKSGHLDKVLLRLADYMEQQWHLERKLKTALVYPTMIVLVAIGIVGFLLEYVVPKMIAVYGNLGQSLPFLTQMLIAISQFVKEDGLIVSLILIALCFVGLRALKKSITLREKFHRFLLRLPFLGRAFITADTARFSRTLSILSASGVSVLEAMTISAQLMTKIPIRKAVLEAVNHVREGAAIHLALKQTTYFSPMSIHMIASGEASGHVEEMLSRVAANQEDDISRLIEVSLALFEPLMILIMGALVLFIVLAVLLPIFSLNQLTG